MKILVAPSAYKSSFSPTQVALAIKTGIEVFDRSTPGIDCQIALAPIADGGDGTIEALHLARAGELHAIAVEGCLGEPVQAQWLELEGDKERSHDENFFFSRSRDPALRMYHKLAIIELASACGIAHLKSEQLNALDSHTIGVGQVLKHCLDLGFDNLVLTVGGSASTDGGMGVLAALGARFLDENQNVLQPCGKNLLRIKEVELSALSRWKKGLRLRVATDVTNPLLGANGAAAVFAPQKGASQEDVETLESGLRHYADILEELAGVRARELSGAGAAGGVPFGLTVAMNASIIPGFQWISAMLDLEAKIKEADLVICAEGKLDAQSFYGKATGELAALCKKYEKPLIALPAKSTSNFDWQSHGIALVQNTAKTGETASLRDIGTNTTLVLNKLSLES